MLQETKYLFCLALFKYDGANVHQFGEENKNGLHGRRNTQVDSSQRYLAMYVITVVDQGNIPRSIKISSPIPNTYLLNMSRKYNSETGDVLSDI